MTLNKRVVAAGTKIVTSDGREEFVQVDKPVQSGIYLFVTEK